MRNKILPWTIVSKKSGDTEVVRIFSGPPPLDFGILGLYLRLNKEVEKGSFSIVVFWIAPTLINFLTSHFLIYFFIGFVHELLGDC